MKKLLFALPFAALLFVACNTSVKGKNGVEYKNAVQYNDYIVNKQMEVVNMIMQFGKESQTDLSKAEKTIDEAVAKVDKSITDIEGMPDWKGNTALRDNAVALFKFYKNIFSTDYKRIIAVQKDGEVTTEEENEYSEIMKKITASEGKLDADFKTAQVDFASKNNFKIVTDQNMQNKLDEMNKK